MQVCRSTLHVRKSRQTGIHVQGDWPTCNIRQTNKQPIHSLSVLILLIIYTQRRTSKKQKLNETNTQKITSWLTLLLLLKLLQRRRLLLAVIKKITLHILLTTNWYEKTVTNVAFNVTKARYHCCIAANRSDRIGLLKMRGRSHYVGDQDHKSISLVIMLLVNK